MTKALLAGKITAEQALEATEIARSIMDTLERHDPHAALMVAGMVATYFGDQVERQWFNDWCDVVRRSLDEVEQVRLDS